MPHLSQGRWLVASVAMAVSARTMVASQSDVDSKSKQFRFYTHSRVLPHGVLGFWGFGVLIVEVVHFE